jgi:hypothetical protein
MHVAQQFRKLHFLGCVEGSEIAGFDHSMHGFVHRRVSIAQDVCADTHETHVEKRALVKIPDPTTL